MSISKIIVAASAAATALGITAVEAQDQTATRPGDEAMTCEQIAMELYPYTQQMVPNLQALGQTQQQRYAQGRAMGEKRRAEEAMLLPLAQAGAVDPTGASKRAYQMALMAQQAKGKAENEAYLNSPLAQENKAQTKELAAQATEMKNNDRIQRLLQLAQEKRCDKK